MKPTLILLVTVLFALPVCAQTQRLYLDANFNAVTDSAKATSKVILSKYSEDTTLWAAKQYTMDDKLVVDGVYKDKQLRVPEGPFKYYNTNAYGDRYLAQSGSFFNGTKFGEWIAYFPDGKKKKLQTFRNNVLNGPYAVYSPLDTTTTLKGNYLKGKKNGEWVAGWGTEIYEDGVLVKSTPSKANQDQKAILNNAADKIRAQQRMINAIEPIDFGKFMSQRLANYFKPYFDRNAGTAIVLTFTITEQGKLTNGRTTTNVSDDIQKKVERAVDAAPYWTPAQMNGKPISQRMTYTLVFDNTR